LLKQITPDNIHHEITTGPAQGLETILMETIAIDSVTVPITVEYLEEDGVYKISCPLLPGCHAWGETLDEAMRSIPGNIRAMLEARRAKHAPIPALFEETNQHTPFVLRMVPA